MTSQPPRLATRYGRDDHGGMTAQTNETPASPETSREAWSAADTWFAERLRPPDDVLAAAIEAGAALPQIQVSPLQGGLLSILARAVGSRRILEIGALFGYSTILLARTLPEDGQLITLEASEDHAAVARANLDRAGLGDRAEVRVGAALDSLAALDEEGTDPFDVIFIDADKANNPAYWDWALKHSRPGALVVVDNVVRPGRVPGAASDEDVVGTRVLAERVGEAAARGDVDATVLQTVGLKGWDGFLIALVT